MMTVPPTDTRPPNRSARLRATTADREHVAGLLAAAVADGSLTSDEAEERTRTAREATHRDEFDVLLADLPVAQVVLRSAGTAGNPRRWIADSRGWVAGHRIVSAAILIVVLVVLAGVGFVATREFDGGGHGEHGPGHSSMRGDHRNHRNH